MEAVEQIISITKPVDSTQRIDLLAQLVDELSTALSIYWRTAARILRASGVNLLDPPDGYFSLEKNFFSALFLYSYHRAGISKSRRVTYAAVNQCSRGMVTGCDNILDDEYKKPLKRIFLNRACASDRWLISWSPTGCFLKFFWTSLKTMK
jgi:hypothetical protein